MAASLIGLLAGGCFVTIFLGVGIFMLVKYFQDKKKTEESQAWSATSGQVTQSYVRESQTRDDDGYLTTTYYPEVRYTYQVMGVEYGGDKVSFGGAVGGGRKKAEEVIAQYPIGKNITVYYDPNKHEDAVIERRMGSKGFLIIGIVFTLIGVCIACIGGVAAILAIANS
jgi:hypothetical protein